MSFLIIVNLSFRHCEHYDFANILVFVLFKNNVTIVKKATLLTGLSRQN